MKIWYQSGASFGANPEYSAYEATMKSYLQSVARPGTQVSVHGVRVSSPYIETSRYEQLLHDHQVVENLLQAQREGFDAFCVGCAFDPGFDALREVADIPILSLSEASMLLACLLSPSFSLLCHHKPLLRRVTELVKRYGLQGRFIECDSLGVTPERLLDGFADPEVVLGPARVVARDAAKKGVCMFVSAEGIINLIIAKHNIRQIEGIPVIEGGGALIKMTEMLVDLKGMGIDRSRLGPYTPLPKEAVALMTRLYGVG